MTVREEIKKVLKEIEKIGKIEFLFCCAGLSRQGLFEQVLPKVSH